MVVQELDDPKMALSSSVVHGFRCSALPSVFMQEPDNVEVAILRSLVYCVLRTAFGAVLMQELSDLKMAICRRAIHRVSREPVSKPFAWILVHSLHDFEKAFPSNIVDRAGPQVAMVVAQERDYPRSLR